MEGKVERMDKLCLVPECRKRFSSIKELRKHSLSHTDIQLECEECDKIFTRKCDLTRHFRIAHIEVGEVECDECGKKFLNKRRLHRHSLVHARQKKKNYSEHKEDFSRSASPQEMNHYEGGIFECGECGKTYSERAPLDVHMNIHRGEKIFECDTCGRHFSGSSHLSRHVLIHTGVKKFKCIACGKRFARRDKLHMHMKTHPGVKFFVCNVGKCCWKFTHKAQLDEHKMMHDKTCYICGKSFKRNDKLKRHMSVHTGVKNYGCDMCGKKFSRKDSLDVHLLTHTETKTFRNEECGKKFTKKHKPRVHIDKQHIDTDAFECGECGDTFLKRTQLIKHMAKHE